jgi:hypothetical protein
VVSVARGRGARLPLDTARRLAHALAVSVEWLSHGTGPRERSRTTLKAIPAGISGSRPPASSPATCVGFDKTPSSRRGERPSRVSNERKKR